MVAVIVVILTLLFILGSISPLLVTDDMQDIVEVGQSLELDRQ
jgi:hypothetical protein